MLLLILSLTLRDLGLSLATLLLLELDTSGLGLIVSDSVTSWLRLDDSVGLGSGERLEGDSLTEALSLTVSD